MNKFPEFFRTEYVDGFIFHQDYYGVDYNMSISNCELYGSMMIFVDDMGKGISLWNDKDWM